jgi:uncharacterized repeat protein (TIGR03803 family)
LIQAAEGNFYGTTLGRGAATDGTIFRITPAGVETVLRSFGSGQDGSNPLGPLIQGADGNFHGTTELGGTGRNGIVFKF